MRLRFHKTPTFDLRFHTLVAAHAPVFSGFVESPNLLLIDSKFEPNFEMNLVNEKFPKNVTVSNA